MKKMMVIFLVGIILIIIGIIYNIFNNDNLKYICKSQIYSMTKEEIEYTLEFEITFNSLKKITSDISLNGRYTFNNIEDLKKIEPKILGIKNINNLIIEKEYDKQNEKLKINGLEITFPNQTDEFLKILEKADFTCNN